MILIFLKENDCLRVHEGIRLGGLLWPCKWLVIPQKVNLMTISVGPTSFASKLQPLKNKTCGPIGNKSILKVVFMHNS